MVGRADRRFGRARQRLTMSSGGFDLGDVSGVNRACAAIGPVALRCAGRPRRKVGLDFAVSDRVTASMPSRSGPDVARRPCLQRIPGSPCGPSQTAEVPLGSRPFRESVSPGPGRPGVTQWSCKVTLYQLAECRRPNDGQGNPATGGWSAIGAAAAYRRLPSGQGHHAWSPGAA
jgi:hypothetical protein